MFEFLHARRGWMSCTCLATKKCPFSKVNWKFIFLIRKAAIRKLTKYCFFCYSKFCKVTKFLQYFTLLIKRVFILSAANGANKTNALINVPKKETARKWWFKSNNFKRIHVLTYFWRASDPQRKTSVSHTGQFEKEQIHTSRFSDWKFLLHLQSRSNQCGRESLI